MAETCSTCGASFGSGADLISHTTTAHSVPEGDGGRVEAVADRVLRCAVCGAAFTTPKAFAAHNVRPHRSGPTLRRVGWSTG